MNYIIDIYDNIMCPMRVMYDKKYDLVKYFLSNETTNRIFMQNNINNYKTFFSDPTMIVDRIYLGSAYNAASYNTLVKYNIKYIINVTFEISNYFENDIKYHKIPINDNGKDSIIDYFNDCNKLITDFLDNNEGNILIHCYMGASRSAIITINYLMYSLKIPLEEAINYVRELRSSINPSIKLYDELFKYYNN